MLRLPLIAVLVLGFLARGGSARAAESSSTGSPERPDARALRIAEPDLLARFVPEVRARRVLAERALALWRTHFEASAEALTQRFLTEEDWRPAYADVAALVDEFLEASELPRAGAWPAGDGKVWVELLDARTGRRVRELRARAARPVYFTPRNEPKAAPAEAVPVLKRAAPVKRR